MTSAKCKVLLLAGGLGTRLRPLTDHAPKCLIPINGRPLLDYWLARFDAAGTYDVLINVHHLPRLVEDYVARVNAGGRFRMRVFHEPKLLGSAGTVHANRDWVGEGETGLIVYADNLSNVDLRALLDYHHGHGQAMTMMLFRTPYPEKCGIAELGASGKVVSFIEKPKEPKSNLANAGLYALTGSAYREIADMDKFDIGFDVLPSFVGRMMGWEWTGYHRDIGTSESLRAAEAELASWDGDKVVLR
jgi:mannose-1-phosphate guanylyltransferase